MPGKKMPPKNFDIARDAENNINFAIPDFYLGLRFSVRQYPIIGRKWSLSLPVVEHEKAKQVSEVEKLDNAEHRLTIRHAKKPPLHPYDPRKYLPPDKNLYDLGNDRNNPDRIQASLTMNVPLVKDLKKGFRGVKDNEKTEKEIDAEDLNDVLGQVVAIYVMRDHTYRYTDTGMFSCAKIGGLDSTLLVTEKLAIKLFAYVKTTIAGKTGIFEIKKGVVDVAKSLTKKEYDEFKLIKVDQFHSPACGSMPLIPGIMQVHVLIEQTDSDKFILNEVYCDGDRVFPDE